MEFAELMKTIKKMCKCFDDDCDGCPLGHTTFCGFCPNELDDDVIDSVEDIVTSYQSNRPTWRDLMGDASIDDKVPIDILVKVIPNDA